MEATATHSQSTSTHNNRQQSVVSSTTTTPNTTITSIPTATTDDNTCNRTTLAGCKLLLSNHLQTRNKRKNFNPRCSASTDEDDTPSALLMHATPDATTTTTTTSLTSNTPAFNTPNNGVDALTQLMRATDTNRVTTATTIADKLSRRAHEAAAAAAAMTSIDASPHQHHNMDPMSAVTMNWRKLLPSQARTATAVGAPNDAAMMQQPSNSDLTKFYKIPNTNFSIAKTALNMAAAAASCSGGSPRQDGHQSGGIAEAVANVGDNPQAKFEFAFNAFNAVKELLNVYGLQLSPDDIVDAFKNPAMDGFSAPALEPPTPPRTPITNALHHLDLANIRQNGGLLLPTHSAAAATAAAAAAVAAGLHRGPTPLDMAALFSAQMQAATESRTDTDTDAVDTTAAINLMKSSNSASSSPLSVHSSSVPYLPQLDASTPIRASSAGCYSLQQQQQQLAAAVAGMQQDSDAFNESSIKMELDDGGSEDVLYDNSGMQRLVANGSPRDVFSDDQDSPHHFDLSQHLRAGNEDSNASDERGSEGTFNSGETRLSFKNIDKYAKHFPMNYFTPMLQQLANIQNEEKQLSDDSLKYLTKFTSFLDCNNKQCIAETIREHYHCYDVNCMGKVLCKKDEIIRHLKWHKKRNESLNHGFLRFSSSDDCSLQFGTCSHNRKQTHYHCIQQQCDKVYISTSDVQMHANCHRKDEAIFQEGFQRYRAIEECKADYCIYANARTTHFHCRRDNCRYTFKNKADMEKHKSYHTKDTQLTRDGFKKFLKTEACPYTRCRFSRICNHIHCIRDNCFYVLHSSGQLLSHKRKHERLDSEQAYQRFKMAQKLADAQIGQQFAAANQSGGPSNSSGADHFPSMSNKTDQRGHGSSKSSRGSTTTTTTTSTTAHDLLSLYGASGSIPVEMLHQLNERHQLHNMLHQAAGYDIPKNGASDSIEERIPKNIIQSGGGNGGVMDARASGANSIADDIEFLMRSYFSDNCTTQVSAEQNEPLNLDVTASRANTTTTTTTTNGQTSKDANTAPIECSMCADAPHLHCLIRGCEAVVARTLPSITEHMRMHEMTAQNAEHIIQSSNPMQITSIEGFFNRKRGRPPKNRVVEVYNDTQHSPQAIFTSFKLDKGEQSGVMSSGSKASMGSNMMEHQLEQARSVESRLFKSMLMKQFCKELDCQDQELHFHCPHLRCHYVTNSTTTLENHVDLFHDSVVIQENFKYFDAGFDCRQYGCPNKKNTNHFHCIHCQFSFTSESEQATHVCRSLICKVSSAATESETMAGAVAASSAVEINSRNSPHANNNNNNNNNNIISATNNNDQSNSFQDDDSVAVLGRKLHQSDNSGCTLTVRSAADLNKISDDSAAMLKSEVCSDDERVLVVRAAGTYFPQNSNDTNESQHTLQQQLLQQQVSPNATAAASTLSTSPDQLNFACQRPFCKLKKKTHFHCDLCNQAFCDEMKMKIHFLKHQTTKLGHLTDCTTSNNIDWKHELNDMVLSSGSGSSRNEPHDLTTNLVSPTRAASSSNSSQLSAEAAALNALSLQPNFVENMSMQNIHLAHLAFTYQQNPYYYQNLYPFMAGQGMPPFSTPESLQAHVEQQAAVVAAAAASSSSAASSPAAASAAAGNRNSNQQLLSFIASNFPTAAAVAASGGGGGNKRSAVELDLSTYTPPKKIARPNKTGTYKIFKDEPIPQGYLKFRFNEDCNFNNCGYRNHQSHFHCCRNDCFYSFCDKTRFVQHTARHERLDKLMGDDFKQYRANMRCGYDECVYNKNLVIPATGQNNKSSHFHCLKCNFICSDTNKVVAHRRQHSKLEFIRMAGFRKVANNEKCNSMDADNANAECSYSMKQTHYHCLVCDCSVLSKAQLSSHRHRV